MKLINEITIERKQLTDIKENNKYAYCPFCRKAAIKANTDYKTIPKLVYTKNMQIWENEKGEQVRNYEEFWRCLKCQKNITVEMFLNVYEAKRNSRYGEK